MSDSSPVEIAVARDGLHATHILDLLNQAGIQGQVVGENLQAAAGELGLGYNTAPRIWVREIDAARARELIAQDDAEMNAPDHGEEEAAWVCPNCSESVDAEFDLCWSCQTERPA